MAYYLNLLKGFIYEKPLWALSVIGMIIGVSLTLNAMRYDYYTMGIKASIQFNNCQFQTIHDIDLNNPMNNASIGADGLNCLKNIDPKKSDFEFVKDDILGKKELYNFKN